MRHLTGAWLLCVLLYIMSVHCALDDSVITKDLYAILGVKKSASIKEIKKSFRKLARKHHPDKSKPDDVKSNEKLFRDIAEAYEVLSSPEQREEYDDRRTSRTRDRNTGSNQQPQYNDQNYPDSFANTDEYAQQDLYDNMFSASSMFESPFSGGEFNVNSDFYQPTIVGSVLNTGQILFPYDPIMTTSDRTTFATLDESCSFVIYQGDLDLYIRRVLMQESTQPVGEAFDFDIVYKTEQFPSLRGNCFAGLDESGVFHIFSGHPGMTLSQSMWSTSSNTEYYNAFFERYSMVLSNDGVLTIYQTSRQRHPAVLDKCVWSSTSSSCNAYVSAVRQITTKTQAILKRHFSWPKLRETFARQQQNVQQSIVYKAVQICMLQFAAKLRQLYTQIARIILSVINKYIQPVSGNATVSNASNGGTANSTAHTKKSAGKSGRRSAAKKAFAQQQVLL